mmetsp:Transcript_106721/g.206787  ORF Transcript_106721/g.206787 Transcript_106721/m.206787 type:complete len:349 (+) Transcript_106721:56-1102(+)
MFLSTEQAYGLALCLLFSQSCRHYMAFAPSNKPPTTTLRKSLFCLNTHLLCGVCLMSRCWLVTYTYALPVMIYFWFPFLTVLALFESMCMQWLTDMYEWRALCFRQPQVWLVNGLNVSAMEAFLAYTFWGMIEQTMRVADPQSNMMMTANLSNFPRLLAMITASFWKAFIWEAFFDLAHYCRHRGAHTPSLRWLFHRRHDVHHATGKSEALVAYENFSVHWTDLVFGTAFDYLAGFVMLRLVINVMNAATALDEAVTLFHVCLFYTYARQVELLGHCGDTYWTPPNIFRLIPWCLGCELKIEDHDYHHIILRGNYCKRLKLWDVVFGTYYPAKNVGRAWQPNTAKGGS